MEKKYRTQYRYHRLKIAKHGIGGKRQSCHPVEIIAIGYACVQNTQHQNDQDAPQVNMDLFTEIDRNRIDQHDDG